MFSTSFLRTLRTIAFAATFMATAATVSSKAFADGDDTPLTNLIALSSQRLALAEPVARWKWANHESITDEPREAALLARMDTRAKAAGIDPAFARDFFRDQIEASK